MILRPPRGFKGALVKKFTPKARTGVWLLKPVPLPSGGGPHFLWEVLNGFGLDFELEKKRGGESPPFFSTISTVKNKSVTDRLYISSKTVKGVVNPLK